MTEKKVIIGHACFDSYRLAEETKKRGIPVISGPRIFRYDNETGQIRGTKPQQFSMKYTWDAGATVSAN